MTDNEKNVNLWRRDFGNGDWPLKILQREDYTCAVIVYGLLTVICISYKRKYHTGIKCEK